MTVPIVTLNIFPPKYSVTGIRAEDKTNSVVIITGSCPIPNSGNTLGMIYRGPKAPNNTSGCSWNPADSMGCICLLPKINGVATVATSVLYGPDTYLFTPAIGEQNVRVVGSYRLQTGYDHGVMYTGPLDLIGLEDHRRWDTIDMNSGVAGSTVANTILHSTMGDVIVGNYDLVDGSVADGKFNAFIYFHNVNVGTKYFDLKQLLGLPDSKLVTAYGVWRNNTHSNTNSTSYTIAGGLRDRKDNTGVNVGFLVDFDTSNFTTRNLTEFPFGNVPGALTHFEGITRYGELMTNYGPRYYSLAATGDKQNVNRGAAFAVVERNSQNGSFFPNAEWQPVQGTTDGFTTGNTVLENNVYGIYSTSASPLDFQSYVAENLPVR